MSQPTNKTTSHEIEWDKIPFAEHFHLFIQTWIESSQAQTDYLIESGILGDKASDSARAAVRFEVLCLHLYILDHHIRKARTDDELLDGYWRWGANSLLLERNFQLSDQDKGTFIGWRLGRYQDVTEHHEKDETYPNNAVKLDEILYFFAEQLLLSIVMDVNYGGEIGLYIGVVNQELLPKIESNPNACDDRNLFFKQAQFVKKVLSQVTLPLYISAQAWGQGDMFYQRPIEELQEELHQGLREAEELRQLWESAEKSQAVKLTWSEYLRDGRYFRLLSEQLSPETSPTERFVVLEHADQEHGRPLGDWLLYAHDQWAGLKTKHDRLDMWLQLPLGQVETLLRQEDFHYGDLWGRLPQPFDFTGEVNVCAVPSWFLSASSRTFISSVFQEQGLSPTVCLAEDPAGTKAVLIAPCVSEELLATLQSGLPGGITVYGEPEPYFATFSVWDIGTSTGEERGCILNLPSLKEDWRERLESDAVRFLPTGQFLYAWDGRPCDLLRVVESDDETGAGMSLRTLALACYDSARGLVVESADGKRLEFGLYLGDLIHFLRSGDVYVPRSNQDYLPAGIDISHAPRPIQLCDLPGAAQRDLIWAHNQFGGVPAGCVFMDEESNPVISIDSSAFPEGTTEWIWRRLATSLPVGVRCFVRPHPPEYSFPLNAPLEVEAPQEPQPAITRNVPRFLRRAKRDQT